MKNVQLANITAAIEMDQPEVDVLVEWEREGGDDAQEI